MSIADKLTRIAINEKLVHDAGYKKALKELCPVFGKIGTIVQFVPAVGSRVEYELGGYGICKGIVVCGKNLYDSQEYPLVDGYYINRGSGAEAGSGTHAEYCATRKYIPVEHLRGQYINLNYIPGGTAPGMAFYDYEKVFLGSAVSGKGNNILVPENAAYMRFSTYMANKAETQIELGNTATDFEAYSGKEILLHEDVGESWEFEAKKRETFTVYTFRENVGDDTDELTMVRVAGLEDPVSVINKLKQQLQVAAEG